MAWFVKKQSESHTTCFAVLTFTIRKNYFLSKRLQLG